MADSGTKFSCLRQAPANHAQCHDLRRARHVLALEPPGEARTMSCNAETPQSLPGTQSRSSSGWHIGSLPGRKTITLAGCNPATEKAARNALLGAVFEALLPLNDQKQIGRPVKHGSSSPGVRAGNDRIGDRRTDQLGGSMPGRGRFGADAAKCLLQELRDLAPPLPDGRAAASGPRRAARSAARRHGLQHLRQSRAVGCGEICRPLSSTCLESCHRRNWHCTGLTRLTGIERHNSGPCTSFARGYSSHVQGPL